MSPSGYTVEVTSLSPNATEKDVYDFFAFSGAIEHVEIVRSGDFACTAYVTFKEPHALETAVLLSGATIADQPVCIARWGHYDDPFDIWDRASWKLEDDASSSASHGRPFISSTGEAVTMAQEVVTTMLSKGYVLGKDALIKAKEFDESYQVSASAAAKVAELSKRIGLTDKIYAGVDAVKSVDEKYHVLGTTKAAASATSRTAAAAAQSVVNSSYFSAGALWVSGALTRAAKAAADLGTHGMKK
ncbi:binding partner of ACD11 1 isoform X2 [Magnolia sinica]|uniref:binding partner of ACD11 1 isoform X2 n=1 Tax=Magnolia sinica TaxID=86752 RepID=UPI002659A12F|nr:binding partner of ACD11 1 isoform X2 [Magnolia sinica]